VTWNPDEPYNALPEIPPAIELETRAVLKATIEARDLLGRLDASARALPNASVLINAIPLLEAQASSEIENIVTTTDELFSAAHADDPASSPAAREALRYRTALRRGFERIRARPLTSSTAIEVCTTLHGHDVEVRTGAVYIGDPASGHRTYTPPDRPRDLSRLLENWTEFVNAPSHLDPLVRMAVAHYQFEAIHPFTDGNGRTGRILNVLMLCDAGLLHLPVLYLSRHIIETKDEYYRRLTAVTAGGAWEDWARYMIEAVRSTAARTLDLVRRITDVETELVELTRAALGAANHDVIAVLMEQPYARTRDVIARSHVSRPTATKWLKELVSHGVLQELRVGREVLYINTRLMDVLRRP
jgi:Fic family protein